MVRVVGRQVPGGEGVTGYGFVVSLHPTANGAPGLLIAVRRPCSCAIRWHPHPVSRPTNGHLLPGNLAHPVAGQLLDAHLPPGQGDLAMIVAPGQVATPFRPVAMADLHALLAGAAAWQSGRAGTWEPPIEPGHFHPAPAIRLAELRWLARRTWRRRGRDPSPRKGLAGMLVSEDAAAKAGIPARVLPRRSHGRQNPFLGPDLGFPPRRRRKPNPKRARIAGHAHHAGRRGRPPRCANVHPRHAGPRRHRHSNYQAQRRACGKSRSGARPTGPALHAAELAAARSSWAPPTARPPVALGKPAPAPLFALPREDSRRLGALPPGRQLPQPLWESGAYQLQRRLDGGAWFLAGAEGQPIGYVRGADVMELWPPPPANAPPPTGKVVQDWVVNDQGNANTAHATLRDAGAYDDLTIPVACRREFCNSVMIYTPGPPAPGAIVPTLRILPINGAWRQNAIAMVHVQLPHAVVDTKGVKLMACIGQGTDCDEQQLLPPSG